MNSTKVRYISLLFFMLVYTFASFPDDGNDFNLFDSFETDAFLSTTNFTLKASADPIDVLSILEALGVIDLLKERLYLRTYPLNFRNILDSPLFIWNWNQCDYCNDAGIYFFYNETSDFQFFGDSTKINSYLSVSQQCFIDKLQAVLEAIKETVAPDFDAELPIDILSLVENFTVQERRTGMLFNYFNKEGLVHVNLMLPLFYVERNHFVNEQIQQDIARITEPIFGVPTEQEREEVQKRYFISDKLGWGDTRIELDFPGIDLPSFKLRPGIYTTLPTAHAFEKGLYGSTFSCCTRRPSLNLCELVDEQAAIADLSETMASQFFLDALDQLSSQLLNPHLGNAGHLGLGVLARTYSVLSTLINRPWAEAIELQSRMSLEYLVPRTEVRSFVNRNPAAGFAGRNFNNAEQAADNLAFITQIITDRFFPFCYCTCVQPGLIFRSTSRALYQAKKWSIFLGSDSWLQTPESLSSIKAPACQVNDLDLANAQRPLAYMGKVMGGISYHKEKPTYAYTLSLNGDMAYISSGIGKDFTLSFNINIHF